MAADGGRTAASALVVIDLQNDFCDKEGVHGRRGSDLRWVQAVIPPAGQMVEAARDAQVPVIFVRTHHDAWGSSPKHYMRDSPDGVLHHLEPGAWGSEFYGLQPGPDDYVLTKRRYSAFFGTELDVILRNLRVQRLLVAGVATNVCVDTTVRDACMRDFDVAVVRDCVAAYSSDAHEASLANIDRHFGRVIGLEEARKELQVLVDARQ